MKQDQITNLMTSLSFVPLLAMQSSTCGSLCEKCLPLVLADTPVRERSGSEADFFLTVLSSRCLFTTVPAVWGFSACA